MHGAVTGMLAVVVAWTSVSAQRPVDSVERFVSAARDGTRRYKSQAIAIADGFKRVGVEFPAMGEHWVNLQRVMEDTLVPARPSVLIYVNVRGEARLAGVGYTALLQHGEQPPEFPPAHPFWHEHNGTVVDESFPLAHHLDGGTSPTGDATAALRLSILHAWVWAPNADGVFATDNWSLPSVRVGAAAPLELSRDALRGLTLAADSSDYYALMVRTGAGGNGRPLTPQEERAISTVISDHRARAARDAARLNSPHPVPDAAARLASTWLSLWSTLERALPARIPQLRTLRQHL
jgi:hypothetical protein